MDNLQQFKHLYSRAGFGLRFEDLPAVNGLPVKQAVDKLLLVNSDSDLKAIAALEDYGPALKGDIIASKMFRQEQKQEEKELNITWMNRMSATGQPLQEKMALFWNNHFACRSKNAFFAQQLNNIQRKHALGNFKTMLFEVAQSPAMLQFLNNQQNLKGHPNENFARELMELFTIGRGNYTEHDVKESARAFTGYGFNKSGEFVMRRFVHDDGQKTFMGKTGNFTGDDIMNIILEDRRTAYFLSSKLYKYLVNDVPDAAHVNAMADVFYNSGYEIKPLLKFIFTSDWFYEPKNMGNLIKSPVELLVGLNRQFYITYERPEVLLQFQKVLGQVLFYPPNVAGWPGGRSWIDSSSLMYRLKIPSTILNGGVIDFKGKADPEDEAFLAATHQQQQFVATRVQASVNWDKFLKNIPRHMDNVNVAGFLLQPKPGASVKTFCAGAADLKTMVIEMVSTPEYQLS